MVSPANPQAFLHAHNILLKHNSSTHKQRNSNTVKITPVKSGPFDILKSTLVRKVANVTSAGYDDVVVMCVSYSR